MEWMIVIFQQVAGSTREGLYLMDLTRRYTRASLDTEARPNEGT